MSHFDRPDTYLVPTPGLGRRYYDRQSKPEGRGKPDRQKTENIYKHLLYMAYTSFDNLNTVYIYSLISFLSLNHITLQKQSRVAQRMSFEVTSLGLYQKFVFANYKALGNFCNFPKPQFLNLLNVVNNRTKGNDARETLDIGSPIQQM